MVPLIARQAAFGLASSLSIGVLLGSANDADAHSWYPKECCSNHDCVAADTVVDGGADGKTVIVGQTRIPIPDGQVRRASPDGRVHVCFRSGPGELYGDPNYLILCLFLPPES